MNKTEKAIVVGLFIALIFYMKFNAEQTMPLPTEDGTNAPPATVTGEVVEAAAPVLVVSGRVVVREAARCGLAVGADAGPGVSIADAGDDQRVGSGATVTLDGSGSTVASGVAGASSCAWSGKSDRGWSWATAIPAGPAISSSATAAANNQRRRRAPELVALRAFTEVCVNPAGLGTADGCCKWAK